MPEETSEKAVSSHPGPVLEMEKVTSPEHSQAVESEKAVSAESGQAVESEKAASPESGQAVEMEKAVSSEHSQAVETEKAASSEHSRVLTKSLVDLAVESWRFNKVFARVLQELDPWKVGKYQGKRRWFQGRLEEALKDAGLKIVDVQGQPFDPGVAATPLNGGDFGAEDALVIDRMIEPIIMGPDGVVRPGTVMLKKEASS